MPRQVKGILGLGILLKLFNEGIIIHEIPDSGVRGTGVTGRSSAAYRGYQTL